MRNTRTTEGVILKRSNLGETDRFMMVLTPDSGKVACIAKGVRKISSTQRASLEPANHVTLQLIETSSLPLVTQSRLIEDFAQAKQNLSKMKQLCQVLEIVDVLCSEGESDPELFQQVLSILELINQPGAFFSQIKQRLSEILIRLGYQDVEETKYESLLEYVGQVADRPLHSYDYLTVK